MRKRNKYLAHLGMHKHNHKQTHKWLSYVYLILNKTCTNMKTEHIYTMHASAPWHIWACINIIISKHISGYAKHALIWKPSTSALCMQVSPETYKNTTYTTYQHKKHGKNNNSTHPSVFSATTMMSLSVRLWWTSWKRLLSRM